MSRTSVVQSEDAKEAALSFVLGQGSNKVLWNECHLVWDSWDLFDSSQAEPSNQMAVFGVRGKVETQSHSILNFQIRYILVPETEFPFRLHAVVTSPVGESHDGQAGQDKTEEIDIVQSDLPRHHEQSAHFRDAVYSLTRRVQSEGLEATIRSFMTSGDASSTSTAFSLGMPNGTTVVNGT